MRINNLRMEFVPLGRARNWQQKLKNRYTLGGNPAER